MKIFVSSYCISAWNGHAPPRWPYLKWNHLCNTKIRLWIFAVRSVDIHQRVQFTQWWSITSLFYVRFIRLHVFVINSSYSFNMGISQTSWDSFVSLSIQSTRSSILFSIQSFLLYHYAYRSLGCIFSSNFGKFSRESSRKIQRNNLFFSHTRLNRLRDGPIFRQICPSQSI